MLSLSKNNFYLYTTPADMRLEINGLSGLMHNMMQLDSSATGVIYVFNQRRSRVKLLCFEGDGHPLCYKCLSRAPFGIPVYDPLTRQQH